MPEADFQKWYAGQAASLGLDPNPDDVRHYYDWRSAYRAGAKPDASGHWPSQFKLEGHPRMVIGGVDTRTGKRIGSRGMPISKYLGRRAARAMGKAVKAPPPTPAQIRAAKVAKLEAGRRAEALKRQPGATRKVPRTPVKPLTHREKAAARQESATRAIGMGGLLDALKKKKP